MPANRLSVVTWVALAALAVVLAVSYVRFASPDNTALASPTAPAGRPTPIPTVNRSFVQCSAEVVEQPVMLAGDPCDSALAAVTTALDDVGLPIEEVILESRPFYCDVIWPGVATPPPGCSGGFAALPGQYMHAWVSFRGSDVVAAVLLGLNLPDDPDQPGATRPPWSTTVVAVEVPPAGWVMP